MALHDMDPWTRSCTRCGATKAGIIAGDRDLDCPGRDGNILGITHRIIKMKQDKLRRQRGL